LALLLAATLGLLAIPSSLRSDPIPLPAADQAKVDDAIARGVAFLKSTQGPDGTWTPKEDAGHKVGYAALGGLTLLQCGQPARDPSVLAALQFIRSSLEKIDNTYELALTILFIDRFDAANVGVLQGLREQNKAVIEVLTLRLMAGQTITGGWSYSCPILTVPEHQKLLKTLLDPKPKLTAAQKKMAIFQDLDKLMVKRPALPPGQAIPGASDNSTTHFAVLAIWAAQRIGVPVERSVRLIGKHFRTSQNSEGSWGYSYSFGGGQPPSGPMTCAGLLGLAVEHGYKSLESGKKIPPQVRHLLPVATAVGEPTPVFLFAAAAGLDALTRSKDPVIAKGFEALGGMVGQPVGKFKDVAQGNLYFLWAVERVAMLYDLPTIGNKDWYRWGAEMLLSNQQLNGGWVNGGYPVANPASDTCFALLFLQQANLTRDLTSKLNIVDKGTAPPPPHAPTPTPVASAPPPSRVIIPPPEPAKAASPPPPAPAAAETPTQEEPKKSKLWLIIALGGGALLLLGGGAVLVVMSMQGKNSAPAVPKAAAMKRKRKLEQDEGETNGKEKARVRKKNGPARSRD
jgi:hypothetical protein